MKFGLPARLGWLTRGDRKGANAAVRGQARQPGLRFKSSPGASGRYGRAVPVPVEDVLAPLAFGPWSLRSPHEGEGRGGKEP